MPHQHPKTHHDQMDERMNEIRTPTSINSIPFKLKSYNRNKLHYNAVNLILKVILMQRISWWNTVHFHSFNKSPIHYRRAHRYEIIQSSSSSSVCRSLCFFFSLFHSVTHPQFVAVSLFSLLSAHNFIFSSILFQFITINFSSFKNLQNLFAYNYFKAMIRLNLEWVFWLKRW